MLILQICSARHAKCFNLNALPFIQLLITSDRQDQTPVKTYRKWIQEYKLMCDHLCLTSLCLHVPNSLMNMEGTIVSL